MADGDGNAHGAQALDIGAVGRVRALNLVAQIVHDLGDAAHADAADADEMDGADIERNAGGDGRGHHAASFDRQGANFSTISASLPRHRAWPAHGRAAARCARSAERRKSRSASAPEHPGVEVALRARASRHRHRTGFRHWGSGCRPAHAAAAPEWRDGRSPSARRPCRRRSGRSPDAPPPCAAADRGRKVSSSARMLGIGVDLRAPVPYLRDGIAARPTAAACNVMRQAGHGGGHDLAQGARALAAAEHQKTQRPVGLRRIVGRAPQRHRLRAAADCR